MKELYVEIDKILGRVRTHPEYGGCLSKKLFASAQKSANIHSLNIEKESERQARNHDGIDQYHQSAEEALESLANARNILARDGLNATTLVHLGKIIQPDNKYAIRQSEVIFGDQAGLKPERIIDSLGNLEYRLQFFPGHAIDRAIEAHIEMVRIHPYQDGNGRASRLLQNYCLEERAYPPAILSPEEKPILFPLLSQTISERNQRGTSYEHQGQGEKGLRYFIAQAIHKQAIAIENELKKQRQYVVEIQADSKSKQSAEHIVANSIRSQARRSIQTGIKVNKIRNKGHEILLYVCGDISTQEIESAIQKRLETQNLTKIHTTVKPYVDADCE
jgi:hypothetical protein